MVSSSHYLVCNISDKVSQITDNHQIKYFCMFKNVYEYVLPSITITRRYKNCLIHLVTGMDRNKYHCLGNYKPCFILYIAGLFGLTYLNHLLKAVGVLFLSAIITILAITALGFCMNFLNRPMSWFSRPWMMIGLYIAPALFVNISIHCMVKERLYKVTNFKVAYDNLGLGLEINRNSFSGTGFSLE